jgi:hypothetical protein
MVELLDLPEELLCMIVDAAATSPDGTQQLRLLRLVCTRFASMHSLLVNLFHSVRLICDISTFGALSEEALATAGVASFVRHITFVPPLHTLMTLSEFKQVFQNQASQRYGCYAPDSAEGNRIEQPRRSGRLAKKLDGASGQAKLHTERQLRKGHKQYDTAAVLTLFAIEQEIVLEKWTPLLKLFPRCSSYGFALVDYNLIGKDFEPMIPKCIVAPAPASRTDSQRYLYLNCDAAPASVVSEVWMEQILKCMLEAESTIESFAFHHAVVRDIFSSDCYNVLEQLDLSHLKHLTMHPYAESTVWATPEERGHGQDDIHHMLQRAANSLESFTSKRCAAFLHWHGEPIRLPKLRRLALGDATFESDYLSTWLEKLPNLEEFSIEDAALETDEGMEPAMNWKKIIDRLRDHSTLRRGTLVFEPSSYSDFECFFDKDEPPTEEQVKRMQRHVNLDLNDKLSIETDIWLAAYICGQIEWAGLLEYEFELDEYEE